MGHHRTEGACSIASCTAAAGIYLVLFCALSSALPELNTQGIRQLLQELGGNKKGGKKGDVCGTIAGYSCDPGLACNGMNPDITDASGTCGEPTKPGEEGGICAGFAGFKCRPGLVCEGVATYPDASGTCVKVSGPTPGIKGGTCRSFSKPAIQCEPGLTCLEGVSVNPDVYETPGICVDAPCKCKSEPLSAQVCATNPDTLERESYKSLCYANCLKATEASPGRCSSKTKAPTRTTLLCKCAPTKDAFVCGTVPTEGGLRNVTFENPCDAACEPGSQIIDFNGPCQDDLTEMLPQSAASCSCIYTDEPVCEIATQLTLPNLCEAKCRGAGLVVLGACNRSAPTPEFDCVLGDCPQTTDLVCGSDGKTYSNPCNALCAKVQVVRKGRCDIKPCPCSKELEKGPVCAMDLKTGQNSTYADTCEAGCAGVFILYRGACATRDPDEIACRCRDIKLPVCATNPKTAITSTYDNSCVAGCGRFPVVNKGVCKNPGSVKGQKCNCGNIPAPVCATQHKSKGIQRSSRRVTYANLCTASCSGAKGYTPGKCRS